MRHNRKSSVKDLRRLDIWVFQQQPRRGSLSSLRVECGLFVESTTSGARNDQLRRIDWPTHWRSHCL